MIELISILSKLKSGLSLLARCQQVIEIDANVTPPRVLLFLERSQIHTGLVIWCG